MYHLLAQVKAENDEEKRLELMKAHMEKMHAAMAMMIGQDERMSGHSDPQSWTTMDDRMNAMERRIEYIEVSLRMTRLIVWQMIEQNVATNEQIR